MSNSIKQPIYRITRALERDHPEEPVLPRSDPRTGPSAESPTWELVFVGQHRYSDIGVEWYWTWRLIEQHTPQSAD